MKKDSCICLYKYHILLYCSSFTKRLNSLDLNNCFCSLALWLLLGRTGWHCHDIQGLSGFLLKLFSLSILLAYFCFEPNIFCIIFYCPAGLFLQPQKINPLPFNDAIYTGGHILGTCCSPHPHYCLYESVNSRPVCKPPCIYANWMGHTMCKF